MKKNNNQKFICVVKDITKDSVSLITEKNEVLTILKNHFLYSKTINWVEDFAIGNKISIEKLIDKFDTIKIKYRHVNVIKSKKVFAKHFKPTKNGFTNLKLHIYEENGIVENDYKKGE
ncbi:hypothetical protein ACJA25_01720 [Mycoplasmopsis hyopharyngis]|uniref:hypothetical protein n=1 Tax=Mycoplasmopsis hyopharyngis TaxID=29558 RepID=UPI0038736B0B